MILGWDPGTSNLHQLIPCSVLSLDESISGMLLIGCTVLGPPKKHQHLLPWTNALRHGLQILIRLQWLVPGLMLFRPDGFHAHEHAGVDDGLLADLSNLAHGHPDGLDGAFVRMSNGGWIYLVIHNGGHVDIFQQLSAGKWVQIWHPAGSTEPQIGFIYMARLNPLRSLLLVLGILLGGLFPNRGSRCGGNGMGVLFFVDNGEILGPGLLGEYSLAWNASTCLFLLLLDSLHSRSYRLSSMGSPAPTMLCKPMLPHGGHAGTHV